MFEPKAEKLLPLPQFIRRLAIYLAAAFCGVLLALALGIFGYHAVAGLSWIDSLLNASMILTGMGPVSPMNTVGAKVFASVYALFSGVVFLSSVGVVFSPIFHRILHSFHLDEAE